MRDFVLSKKIQRIQTKHEKLLFSLILIEGRVKLSNFSVDIKKLYIFIIVVHDAVPPSEKSTNKKNIDISRW